MICERGESEHEYRKYESIKSPCSCGGIISLYSDADAEAESAKQPEADPFDLLCHIAYNAPLRTRRERAEMLKREKKDFFGEYSPQAREVLQEILAKYIEYGTAQFQIPEILKVPPISHRGTLSLARLGGQT